MIKALLIALAMFSGAAAHGQEYFTERQSWVTEHLRNGGKLRDITGLVKPRNWREGARFDNLKVVSDLPSSFNWLDYYEGPAIRNQGSCGSCWAFSVTRVVEYLYFIANGSADNKWFDLAEQTLVSSCESGGSCAGGFFNAFNYIRDKGLPHEKEDPYTARNSSCKSGLNPIQKVTEWKYIGGGNGSPSTEQLKSAIYQYGPISVDVNGSFGSYGSGIYTGCGSTGQNHMVVLTGWKDDATFDQYGGGYWHMDNSWGNWGEDGRMRIVYKSRGGSKCNGIGGTAAYAIIPELEGMTLREHLLAKGHKLNVSH